MCAGLRTRALQKDERRAQWSSANLEEGRIFSVGGLGPLRLQTRSHMNRRSSLLPSAWVAFALLGVLGPLQKAYAAPPKTYQITIESVPPGATIYIDDKTKPIGYTPYKAKVKEGTH